MKVLTLVHAGQWGRPDNENLFELEKADKHPRTSLFTEMLNAELLDEHYLKSVPGWRRFVYRRLPISAAQLIEAFIKRKHYDLIISWSENLGMPFAFILKLIHSNIPHIALFSWISKPKKAMLLSKVHSNIDRIFLWSSYQRDFAINKLGIPESKIVFTRWNIDQNFWRPQNVESNTICAAGREMRDYSTFIKAMEGLTIPCHIAVPFVDGRKDLWKDSLLSQDSLPKNITIGEKSFTEMRDLYARSRFVVVPLLKSSDTDNGVTVILEAMAMGKPVICSKTKAQVDVIKDGVTGILVEPENPEALREAIQYLWDHPEKAEQMGIEGRRYVEQYHTYDSFVHLIKQVADEVLKEKSCQSKTRKNK